MSRNRRLDASRLFDSLAYEFFGNSRAHRMNSGLRSAKIASGRIDAAIFASGLSMAIAWGFRWFGFLAAAAFAAGCQEAADPAAGAAGGIAARPPQEVTVVEVREEVWPETVRVQGSLLGDERAVVGAKVAGRVENVLVDLGSVVAEGDLLVELDRRELELQVQQAEAQLRQACAAVGMIPEQSESELRREQAPPVLLEKALLDEARASLARLERLPARQAASDSEFERLLAQSKGAEARYQSALNNVSEAIALIGVRRAELALARRQLEESRIVAPFAGVVERRHVSSGEYVQVGQQVVTLVRTDTLRFTAGVPEIKAGKIAKGQTIRIRIAGESAPIVAAISRVSPMLTQTSRALWIEADVPNPGLNRRAGLFAEADIVVDANAKTLVVPAAAVSEFALRYYVCLVG
jgi:multidrug efflux pump subunit AcrA (membrane-fusion protein)